MATMDGIKSVNGIQGLQPIDNMLQGGVSPGRKVSAEKAISKVATEDFMEKIQAVLSSTDISVGFAKYGNDKTAIVVYNKETGNIIREIPPKEIQQLQLHIEEMIGMIFNNTA